MSLETIFCFCNLWGVEDKEVPENRKQVSVKCGHVFHSDCLDRWIHLNKVLVAPDDIRCPRCPEKLSTSSRELLLDVGYSDVEKAELKTKIGAAEIKILLGIIYDQLEGKIALNPNWRDLTPVFRDELVGTLNKKSKNLQRTLKSRDANNCELVQLVIDEYIEAVSQRNGGKFCWEHMSKTFQEELLQKLRRSSRLAELKLDQVPLTPKTFKLLVNCKEDETTLLAIMTSSYIAEVVNGSCDVLESLCSRLLHQRIIESLHLCGVQKPEKSAKLFKLQLLERKNSDRDRNEDEDISDESDLHTSDTSDSDASDVSEPEYKGVECRFVHDSVEHLFFGMIGSRAKELFKITDNGLIKREDQFSMYFLNYFLDLLTAAPTQAECVSDTFRKLRAKIIKPELLVACMITNSQIVKVLKAVITHYEETISEKLLKTKLFYFINYQSYGFSFLHLAALSDNLKAVKLLTRFLTKSFQWEALITLLLRETSSCSDDVIQMRKVVIAELLNYNKMFFKGPPPTPVARKSTGGRAPQRSMSLRGGRKSTGGCAPSKFFIDRKRSSIPPLFLHHIHVELIKFALEKGANILSQDYDNIQTVMHEAASYMNPDQFHNLVEWVVQIGKSTVLLLKKYDGKTALEIAKSRIEVKPETVKLFRDAVNGSSCSSSSEELLESDSD